MRRSWFWLGLVGLVVWAAAFRFWGLDRFNELVFDENYFAKFANDYLNGTSFLDGHPPLGKYFITLGVWLSQFNPFGYATRTTVADLNFDLPTVSYRWMNALVGSFLPLLVAALAYQLSRRYRYALIAGGLAALDGLLLLESRYALLNIYLLTFGLLGQVCFLAALGCDRKAPRGRWLLAAGFSFGAAMSVKWTGLGFMLGLYTLWAIVQVVDNIARRRAATAPSSEASQSDGDGISPTTLPDRKSVTPTPEPPKPDPDREAEPMSGPSVLTNHPLRKLSQLHWRDLLFYLGVVPVFLYFLLWLPHIHHDPQHSLLGYQKQLVTWHTSIDNESYRYCAPWHTWPWIGRSSLYFRRLEPADALTADQSSFIYELNAIGNPILWWLALLTMGILIVVAVRSLPQIFARSQPAALKPEQTQSLSLNSDPSSEARLDAAMINVKAWTTGGLGLFLTVNYLANLLPWSAVGRCSIIYHYMPSSLFGFLGLAWLLDRGIGSKAIWPKVLSGLAIYAIVFGFFYWLPFFMALPITPAGLEARVWFAGWAL